MKISDDVELIGDEKYCEVCKPGMIVMANNIPKSMDESWINGPSIVLKNAPCICKKKTPKSPSEVNQK